MWLSFEVYFTVTLMSKLNIDLTTLVTNETGERGGKLGDTNQEREWKETKKKYTIYITDQWKSPQILKIEK